MAEQRTIAERRALHPSHVSGLPLRLSLWLWFCIPISFYVTYAQPTSPLKKSNSAMQQHYESAVHLQSIGDIAQAESQYKLFLADALHSLATDRSQIGEYARAAPLFDEALKLTPDDPSLRLDYAEASLVGGDKPKAKSLAQDTLAVDPKSARAHLLLGRALLGMNENRQAKAEFEKAVALDANFEDGYALATADLALADMSGAARIFKEMLAGFGDTAAIHMQFGLAYGNADFPEQAIREFRDTIAEDQKYPGAHYSLGAAYLLRSGDTNFAAATAEFHKELAFHPDDYFSYSQLGYIAMTQHHLQEAVVDLTHATQLDPNNPDNFLLLGQIYAEMDKNAEAEAALRSAIAVTSDPSRNHYQIRGAHYQLGRLLIQAGNIVEGKKEMRISEDLLLQNKQLDKANVTGKPIRSSPFPNAAAKPVDPEMEKAVNAFQTQIGPAIADSYNNLGVIAAIDKRYMDATGNFQQAAKWNPSMEGLDYNWGRAAFAAHLYPQALPPLTRYVQIHPDDVGARSTLGVTQYMVRNYNQALQTLQPILAHVDAVPALGFLYAKALVKTGDLHQGIGRLVALERSNPESAILHQELAEAYRKNAQPDDANREMELYQRLQSKHSSREQVTQPN